MEHKATFICQGILFFLAIFCVPFFTLKAYAIDANGSAYWSLISSKSNGLDLSASKAYLAQTFIAQANSDRPTLDTLIKKLEQLEIEIADGHKKDDQSATPSTNDATQSKKEALIEDFETLKIKKPKKLIAEKSKPNKNKSSSLLGEPEAMAQIGEPKPSQRIDGERLANSKPLVAKGCGVKKKEKSEKFVICETTLEAENGDAIAQYQLGFLYELGLSVGVDHRKAVKWYRLSAEQGYKWAQYRFGLMKSWGRGVGKNDKEAVKWLQRAANQGILAAQVDLGRMYEAGRGSQQDSRIAVKWFLKAAEQGDKEAQLILALMYQEGRGALQDYIEAEKWYRLSANQGFARAQLLLGVLYMDGKVIKKDYIEAYKWLNLCASSENKKIADEATKWRKKILKKMTMTQVAEGQKLAREWTPNKIEGDTINSKEQANSAPNLKIKATGSGFFVSAKGHVLTNRHVIEGCSVIRKADGANLQELYFDKKNDLALLKASPPSPAVAKFRKNRRVELGERVITAGFPLHGIISSGLNVTEGTVSALGPGGDSSFIQISAPVQQGNSGGPLIDHFGNIIGVVVAKLNVLKTALLTGDFPQNINYAIHPSIAMAFLDSQGVKYSTSTSKRKLEQVEIVKRVREFTVLIECWN